MSTKCLIDTSTQNFKKLFDLTRNAGLIDPSVDYNSIVQKKSERWNVLFKVWREHKRRLGRNVFLRPISRIIYGLDYVFVREEYTSLLDEIENVLLNDSEAFSVWAQTKAFTCAFKELMYNELLMNSYYDFQDSRNALLLINGRKITDVPERFKKKSVHILNEEYIRRCRTYYNNYKMIIGKVLPASINWTDEQWMDYTYICGCIKDMYGVDLNDDVDKLNLVYGLSVYAASGVIDYRVSAADIASAPFNYEIAKAVFPDNTDSKIFDFMSDLLRECTRIEEIIALREGWVTKIFKEWSYNPNHMYYNDARKIVFNLNTQH